MGGERRLRRWARAEPAQVAISAGTSAGDGSVPTAIGHDKATLVGIAAGDLGSNAA